MISEVWRDLNLILAPVIKKKDGGEMRIELVTGGIIEFWSLENYDAIRGRKYHFVTINEAAMFRNLKQAWTEVIRATLTDYQGSAVFLSTPKGENYFKELADKENSNLEWRTFRYTSYDNPKLQAS
jgi:hypothetical protein